MILTHLILFNFFTGASGVEAVESDFSGRVFVNTAVGKMMGA